LKCGFVGGNENKLAMATRLINDYQDPRENKKHHPPTPPSDKFNDKIQDYQEQSSTPELEVFVAEYSLALELGIL